MNSMLLLILGIVATGLLFVVAPVVIDIYVRYRGGKVLNCPETLGAAEGYAEDAPGCASRCVW
jgi:hypothetical protein